MNNIQFTINSAEARRKLGKAIHDVFSDKTKSTEEKEAYFSSLTDSCSDFEKEMFRLICCDPRSQEEITEDLQKLVKKVSNH